MELYGTKEKYIRLTHIILTIIILVGMSLHIGSPVLYLVTWTFQFTFGSLSYVVRIVKRSGFSKCDLSLDSQIRVDVTVLTVLH